MSEETLKACPLCGGEAEIKTMGRNGLILRCSKCHFGLKQKVLRLTLDWLKSVLINNWNKRA